jgi:hypothetical protein
VGLEHDPGGGLADVVPSARRAVHLRTYRHCRAGSGTLDPSARSC